MTQLSSQAMAQPIAKTDAPVSASDNLTKGATLSPRMRIARLILIYHFILPFAIEILRKMYIIS